MNKRRAQQRVAKEQITPEIEVAFETMLKADEANDDESNEKFWDVHWITHQGLNMRPWEFPWHYEVMDEHAECPHNLTAKLKERWQIRRALFLELMERTGSQF